MDNAVFHAGRTVGELTDTGQLADGAIQLADGNNTITTNLNVLANSSLTFKDGADNLHVGLKKYGLGISFCYCICDTGTNFVKSSLT